MSISVFSKLIYFSMFFLQCRFASLPRIFAFRFRNVTFATSSEKRFEFVLCTFSKIGLFQEKNKQERWLRKRNFQGYRRNRRQNFQRLVKKDVEFSGVIRKKIGISSGLGFCFWNFQGVQLIQLYITEIPGMKPCFVRNC